MNRTYSTYGTCFEPINLQSEIRSVDNPSPTSYSWHSATESARIRAQSSVLIPIPNESARKVKGD